MAGVSEVGYPDAYPDPPATASCQPKVGTREGSTPLDTAPLSVYHAGTAPTEHTSPTSADAEWYSDGQVLTEPTLISYQSGQRQ